jgi:O-antigen/teichoic acid export membrane protein
VSETTGAAAPGLSSVLTGARWMTISQGATVASQVLSSLILARLISPSEFGLVALVTLIQLFIQQVFHDLGTSSAIVQRDEVSQELLSSVFFLNVAWGVGITAVLLAFADPLGWLLGNGEVVPMLRVASVTFIISTVGLVPSAVVRRKMQYERLAILNYLGFSGGLVFAIVFAFLGFGAWAMVIGGISGNSLATIYAWWSASWRPIRHFDRADIREISSYSLNLTGFQLAVYFTGQGDRLIIGRFVGTAALGFYSMATRLFLTPIQLFGTVFSEVLFPALARVQSDRRTVGETVLRATALGAFALAPLLVGLSAVAGPLVEIALGERWLPAVPLVSILAIVGLIQVVQTNNTTIFRSIGRTDLMMRWGIMTMVATMTGSVVGSPWGTEGIAWGYLAAAFLVSYPLHRMALRLVDLTFRDLLASVAPYFLASGVMAAAVLAVRAWLSSRGASAFEELTVAVAVGAAVYAAEMAVLRPPAIRDARQFLQFRRSNPLPVVELPMDVGFDGDSAHLPDIDVGPPGGPTTGFDEESHRGGPA